MPNDWALIVEAAKAAEIKPCALWAVRQVESAGNGYLPDGRLKILFEGHVFWEQLKRFGIDPQKYARDNPEIVYPSGTKPHYKTGAGEHERLEKAKSIHPEAALCSASWGAFQIMGFNHKLCGFDRVDQFVQKLQTGFPAQLEAVIAFLKTRRLDRHLKADPPNWAAFAEGYNGKGYRRNDYDHKLQRAYAQCLQHEKGDKMNSGKSTPINVQPGHQNMDENLRVYKLPIRFTPLHHTYVVGQNLEIDERTTYGCFGRSADGELVVDRDIYTRPFNGTAIRVCGDGGDPRNDFIDYSRHSRPDGRFERGDTCNIRYLRDGVCHNMCHRLVAPDDLDTPDNLPADFVQYLADFRANVGGGKISALIFGPLGRNYEAYKALIDEHGAANAGGRPRAKNDITAEAESTEAALLRIDLSGADEEQKMRERLRVCLKEASLDIDGGTIKKLESALEDWSETAARIDDELGEKADQKEVFNNLKRLDENLRECLLTFHKTIGDSGFRSLFGIPYDDKLSFFPEIESLNGSCNAANDDPSGGEGAEEEKSFLDTLYEKVTDVIGGDNPNQFFCMMLPGLSLTPELYQYDLAGQKPPIVAAHESRLTNKMFDACHVTGSDNGRTLAQQYLSALNMLTPKLNPDISHAKNILRELLMTNYSYKFDDGPAFNGTLQQVFYRLYEEWVTEKRKWALARQEKREEIEARYPKPEADDLKAIENDYLRWYQTEAESYLAVIEAKLGKVLGIFSVNDMKIIEGVLDSGSGAEVQEARNFLTNARRLNEDGGYTYPVTLEPADWHKYLSTDFAYVNLLETPSALAQKYRTLTAHRDSINSQIIKFSALDKSDQTEALRKNLKAAKEAFDNKADNVTEGYFSGAAVSLKLISGFIDGTISLSQTEKEGLTKQANAGAGESDKKFEIEEFFTKINDISKLQQEYVNAAEHLADETRALIAAGSQNFSILIKELYQQLESVNAKINELKPAIEAATLKHAEGADNLADDLFPNAVSKGFMEVVVSQDASSLNSESSMHSQAKTSSYGASFLFCGYQQSSSFSDSDFSDLTKKKATAIDVGFRATKVAITRNWFNPGVFLLSKDMYNTSSKNISWKSGGRDIKLENKFAEMNRSVFPCYPVAFVIAKDITIRFSSSNSFSDVTRSAFEEHSSKGGGFFCFRGSSSTSDSGQKESSRINSNSKSITIRYPGPQILGYYLEVTPEDESAHLYPEGAEDVSIDEFVKQCKEMLDEFNQQRPQS